MSSDYSRPLLLASGATATSGDLLLHLTRQTVLVSLDERLPGAILAARVLLTTIRRLPAQLMLDIGGLNDATIDDFANAVLGVNHTQPLILTAKPEAPACHVHIGLDQRPGSLRAIPERHGMHIVRDGRTIDPAAASPLGSIFTAAAAAAEIFKVVADVRPDRRSDPAHASFCPVTLTGTPRTAPLLCRPLQIDGALVGLGAIGTGAVLILGELGAEGEIDLVDQQRFAAENVSTYSLGGIADAEAGMWKTELAARALTAARSRRFNESVTTYVARIDSGEFPAPRLILSGLDNVEARHEIQRTWPETLIDGATGDTMVGLHVAKEDGSCLQCFLPKRQSTVSPLRTLADATGLPASRLAAGDTELLPEDLAFLSAERQAMLAPFVGRKICGLADALGLTNLHATDGFRPSVPFVSLQAACLVVGRLVAIELGIAPAADFVQYDALFGAGMATIERRNPLSECYCQQRAETIRRLRIDRSRSAPFKLLGTS